MSPVSQDDCARENCLTEAPRMSQTPIPQSPLKTQQRTGTFCRNFRKHFVRCNVFAIQTKPSFSSIFTFDLRPCLSSSPVARSHSVPPSFLPSFLLLPFPLPACLLRNPPFPALPLLNVCSLLTFTSSFHYVGERPVTQLIRNQPFCSVFDQHRYVHNSKGDVIRIK